MEEAFIELVEGFGGHGQSGVYEDLISSVDEWRMTRNQAVHAIVKSEFDESSQSIDAFLQKAKESAEEGECLARELCKWCKKAKNG